MIILDHVANPLCPLAYPGNWKNGSPQSYCTCAERMNAEED